MADKLAVYRPIKKYECPCGEDIPETFPTVQPETAKVHETKYITYVCPVCGAETVMKVKLAEIEDYVPPEPPPSEGYLGKWRFDDGMGTTVTDYSDAPQPVGNGTIDGVEGVDFNWQMTA